MIERKNQSNENQSNENQSNENQACENAEHPSEIDDMVALIDSLMREGSMHVRVRTDETAQETSVSTAASNECIGGACMQPTEKQELSKHDIQPEQEEI